MRTTETSGRVAIALLFASAGFAFAAPRCPSTRPGNARSRTIAWVSSTCRTDANGFVGHQELYVQRGERTPVVVSTVQLGPAPDPGLCRLFGSFGVGSQSVLAGFYTQLAVSPDGRHVVVELNDRFSLLDPDHLTDDQRGFYLARSDGSDLVKLGPATGLSPFRLLSNNTVEFNGPITFSPDGRYVVYIDLGPASDGTIDAQLWSLRLTDRKKVQLTHFARRSAGTPLLNYVFSFADARTVGFFTIDYGSAFDQVREDLYSVSVDGTELRTLSPVIGPNGQVITQFSLTGRRPAAQSLIVEGTPENPMLGVDRPRELFVTFGKRVLQLTHFNRVDLVSGVVSQNGERAFFSASADPFGCNPTHNCQVFSIDTLGRHLRQLTRFVDGDRSEDGCFIDTAPGCPVRVIAQDRATRSLILSSGCDPLGTNPAAEQIFAIRPDGSGVRQITHARGVVTDTPEVFEVELPGPFAYQ